MIATIPCKAKDGFECPYLNVCMAKLTDTTVTGCGMALYANGLIKYDEIGVQHTVKAEKEERRDK